MMKTTDWNDNMHSQIYRLRNGNIKLVLYVDYIMWTKTFRDWMQYQVWRDLTFPGSTDRLNQIPKKSNNKNTDNVIPFMKVGAK